MTREGVEVAMVDDPSMPFLRWSIKRSFLDYVFRLPDARGWTIDGATSTEQHDFIFSWDSAEDNGDGKVSWKFKGEVGLFAHGGFLQVRIVDPWLDVQAGRGVLSVADAFGDMGGRYDLVVVELAPSGEVPTDWIGEPVRLTSRGVGVFNDVYPEGEMFEPMVVRLPSA